MSNIRKNKKVILLNVENTYEGKTKDIIDLRKLKTEFKGNVLKMGIENNLAFKILKKEYENIIYELSQGEGSLLTYSQTIATIYNKETTGRPRDIALVRNLTRGLSYVIDLLEKDNLFFDKQTLCNINRYVSSDDNFDNLGGFRIGNIHIVGSKNMGVHPSNTNYKFYDLQDDFYKKPITNETIIKLFLNLSKDQYFGDGNKRTAQLMMNGLLVKNNNIPFVLNFKETKNIDAILKYYDNNIVDDIYEICLEKQKEIANLYCVELINDKANLINNVNI